MKDRLKALLLLLGVSAEHADKLLAADEQPADLTNEAVKDAALKKIRTALAADPTFTDPLKKQMSGKLLDILEGKLRKAFPTITDEEIDALPEQGRYDAMVELAGKHAAEAAKKGGTEEDAEKRAEQLRDLNKQIKDLKAANKKLTEEDIPAAKNAGEAERENVRLERALERELNKGDGLVVDVEFATPSVMAKLRAKYDLKLLEDGSVKLLKKGTTDPDFDAQHNEITFGNEVERIAGEAKLRKLNNGEAGGKKKGKGGVADEGGEGDAGGGKRGNIRQLPGQDKAKEHLKKFQERRVAAGDEGDEEGDE